MRKIKKISVLILAFAFLWLGWFVPCALSADAAILDKEIISSGFNAESWFMPSDNPGIKLNSGIVFDETSTENSYTVANTKIENLKNAGKELCFDVKLKLSVADIPKNTRFGLVFGRSSLTALPVVGRKNSSFVYFEIKDGKLYCGAEYFDDQGAEIKALDGIDASAAVADYTQKFDVNLYANTSGGVKLKLGKQADWFYESEDVVAFPVAGYFGFGQTGNGSAVTVSDITIKALTTVTPENSNIYEDFSSDSFNTNEFYTRSKNDPTGKSYVKVKNNRLEFANTKGITTGYLSTKMEYSNFDLTIDIPYLARKAQYDENWNHVAAVSEGISINVGAEQYDNANAENAKFSINIFAGDGSGADGATHTVVTVVEGGKEVKKATLTEDRHIWNGGVGGNRPITLKVRMNDQKLTLCAQIDGGYTFSLIDDYVCENYIQGFIQFGGYVTTNAGNRVNSFAVDKISLVNTDYDAKIIYVARKDNTSLAIDNDYIDADDDGDLIDNKLTSDKGCSGTVGTGGMILTMASLGAVMTYVKRRGNK